MTTGEWKEATAKSYLKVKCINPKLQKEIITCAKNVKTFVDAHQQENKEIIAAIDYERQREPEKHVQWKPPPVWSSGLDLMRFHKAGMHEIFLGVVSIVITANFTLRKVSIIETKT